MGRTLYEFNKDNSRMKASPKNCEGLNWKRLSWLRKSYFPLTAKLIWVPISLGCFSSLYKRNFHPDSSASLANKRR